MDGLYLQLRRNLYGFFFGKKIIQKSCGNSVLFGIIGIEHVHDNISYNLIS